ncbi:MAG: SDR family oxidoreductase, partial [Candidatus Omnitrophica bacterium]|nr:SDR family oxidoreductase [Candidatus Omnitrophota bacterium]
WSSHRFGLTADRWNFLKGKSIWITGAGTGYGRSMAIGFAAARAQVILTGRRREKLEETVAEMQKLGIDTGSCVILPADLSQPKQIHHAGEVVKKKCSALYGLIHNAAVPCRTFYHPLQEEKLDHWDHMFRVNVTAPWLLTREIFSHMASGRHVRILFITSEAAWAFACGFGPYNVTKAALNNLMGSLTEEFTATYPQMDIQINALSPGEAKTEMNPYSTWSPFSVVSMTMILLSHPSGGPNGKFFHRDGRHLEFGYASPYPHPLI